MFSFKANEICMAGMAMAAGAGVALPAGVARCTNLHRTVGTEVTNPDSSLIMHDFDLTSELLLKIELRILRLVQFLHVYRGVFFPLTRRYSHITC